jgi:predicted DNA binding CopG/RHH family protein
LVQVSLTMGDGRQLKTWVSKATRERFAAVARGQGISDSALLRHLAEVMLTTTATGGFSTTFEATHRARDSRVTVRVRPEDQALLQERAAARGMAMATYASLLIRSHVRALAPLPQAELIALKRSVSELGGFTRALRSVNWAADDGDPPGALSRENARAVLRVCVALRDHVKALIRANLRSWEQGNN